VISRLSLGTMPASK